MAEPIIIPLPTGVESRYRALLQAARSIFQVENLDDLVRLVLAHSLEIMQAQACSLYLPDEKGQQLTIYSARGSNDSHIHRAQISIDRGVAGRVFASRRSENIPDVRVDPAFCDNFDRKSGFQTKTMLCMPLLDHQKCVGVLQAINPLTERAFDDQDTNILEGLAVIVASAMLRLARDREVEAMARMQGELTTAQEIQLSLLPPPEVRLERAWLHSRYLPARFVSGDFYVTFTLADGSVQVAMGDVSGKGVPAALTAAQVMTEIQALSALRGSLAAWVEQLNHRLCARLRQGRFVAATFLRYNPTTEEVEVVRAGQFAPWRKRIEDWKEIKAPTHLPLGIDPEHNYAAEVVASRGGDQWVLFSDGIIEGRDDEGNDYGWGLFRAALSHGHPEQVVEDIWQSWRRFLGEATIHDDACLVSLTCLPASEICLTSEAKCCKQARCFVEGWAAAAGFDDVTIGQIVLAADEAFTNAIRHAYQGKSGCSIQIRAVLGEKELSLILQHEGEYFDLTTATPRDLAERRPGGLGLHYIQRTFDHIECRPTHPGMILVLNKKLATR